MKVSDVSLSRKQEKLLQELLLGKSIVAAAKQAGIAEQTAHRWLKLPHIQAERERLETELKTAEEQEITRILTTGYALMHKRVEALGKLAFKLETYMEEEQNIWLPDVKSVGTGPTAERVDLIRFNGDLISEYRATRSEERRVGKECRSRWSPY